MCNQSLLFTTIPKLFCKSSIIFVKWKNSFIWRMILYPTMTSFPEAGPYSIAKDTDWLEHKMYV